MNMSRRQLDNLSSGYIERENGNVFYSVSGRGNREIVWMHGLPLHSDAWFPQLLYFNNTCRNYVFDLRGYGRSSKLPTNCNSVTDLYVQDVLAILKHFQLVNPILIGFASGGHAALRFAALHTDKLSKLIVINGSPCFMRHTDWPGGFDEPLLKEYINKIDAAKSMDEIWDILSTSAMNESCSAGIKKLKSWYAGMAEQAGRDTIKAFFSNVAYDDDRALIANINVPTLIISSRMGEEVPSETALFLRQKIKNAQLFEINDIDHYAFATQSGLVNRVIEQFIEPSCDIILPEQ
ncbi:alpha/beta fold hydrolase [Legionella nagasakiensis]|uniref:alpha/beta fold hydrolase n=1 Tax=Legionella nagasakiensis TaxID=535290 RepID=UPI0013EF76C3|nr:alpha/beta hydrolase [Legionella nagasakiensis]